LNKCRLRLIKSQGRLGLVNLVVDVLAAPGGRKARPGYNSTARPGRCERKHLHPSDHITYPSRPAGESCCEHYLNRMRGLEEKFGCEGVSCTTVPAESPSPPAHRYGIIPA
jgi:hypothetical protein